MIEEKKDVITSIKLPYELWKYFKKESVDNRRSLNSELVHRLEKGAKAEVRA